MQALTKQVLRRYNIDMENQNKTEYVHQPLGEEVRSITGNYTFLKEETINIDGNELLYLIGSAAFDSSCCGTGGCSYALVPGFIIELRHKTNADGNPISIVSPVKDEKTRKEVTKVLMAAENVLQVNFL